MKLTYGNCQRSILEALMAQGVPQDEAMAIWNATKLNRFESDGTENKAVTVNDCASQQKVVEPPDRCLLRVIGGSGDPLLYDRVNGKNDQFRPGETYAIPQGYGKGIKVVRAKCVDWFTILEAPLITTFIFEPA